MGDIRTRPVNAVSGFFSSSVVAATAIALTAPAQPGRRFYVEGYSIQGLGATAAASLNATLTGIGGTKTELIQVPIGATLQGPSVERTYGTPIAGLTNTAVVLSVPSLGVGNTKAVASMWGYYDKL